MNGLIDDPNDEIMCDKNGIGGDARDAEDIGNIKQISDNLTIMRLTLENKQLHDTLDDLLNVLSKYGSADQVHAVLEIVKKLPVPPAIREVLPEGSAEFWKQKTEIAYRQADQYKADYLEACQLVARMHQAATGTIGGPIRGAVEDIEDLRAALRDADAEVKRLREAGNHLHRALLLADEFIARKHGTINKARDEALNEWAALQPAGEEG